MRRDPSVSAPVSFPHLIFLHGLMSSSQGFKAQLLRRLFPGMRTPDFRGNLDERMAALRPLLAQRSDWVIIGSSFGGLMAALYACAHPRRVRKLVLLAPALTWPGFAGSPSARVELPTVVIHGRRDNVIPLDLLRPIAERVFTRLDFRVVDDDHGLRQTAQQVDWETLVLTGGAENQKRGQ